MKECTPFEAREANGDFPFVAVRLQDAQLPAFVQLPVEPVMGPSSAILTPSRAWRLTHG